MFSAIVKRTPDKRIKSMREGIVARNSSVFWARGSATLGN
jgi:hypothetical protein